MNRFHDLTGITGVDLHFSDVAALAQKERELRKDHPPIKACYLVPNDLLYGIARMYQALIEDHAVEVHVSRNLSDLAKELDTDEEQLTTEPGH